MTEKIPLTLEARAAFLAARPLLLLNPRSPTNIEIATELWALPILERLSDRMEAELRRLVDAGLPFEALPVVSRIAIWYATKDLMALAVEIEDGTLPEAAKGEFRMARNEAIMDLTGPFWWVGAQATIKRRDEEY